MLRTSNNNIGTVKVSKLFRINDWLVSKLLFNLCFILAAFYFIKPSFLFISETILLMAFYIVSIGAFGYFVNDCFDVHIDQLSGKSNETSKLSVSVKILLAFFLVSLNVILFLLVLPEAGIYIHLLAIQVFLLIFYSAPPIKFKSNALGLFADSLFSFVLPAIICVQIALQHIDFLTFKSTTTIVLLLWLFFIGLRSILIHQQKDFENDLMSGVKTFTTHIGKKIGMLLIKISLLIEVFSIIVLAFILPENFGFALIISFALYLIIECLNDFNKFHFFSGIFEITSNLNILYNYCLFSGIALWMSYQISYLYLVFVLIYILIKRNKILYLLKKFYYSVILFLYFKSEKIIGRFLNLFRSE